MVSNHENPTCRRGIESGFSLVELAVVIAIMGIVMGFAVPALSDLMAGERVKSASFDLITTAMYARSEAGKRGNAISIKPVDPDDLAKGWCVIFGNAADCDLTAPAAETMRVQQAYSTVAFTWITDAETITFGSAGRLSSAVQVEIKDVNNENLKRCVTIDVTGVPSSRSGSC